MLKVKSMAFNELVKAKAKIEAELELRAAKERSGLIEAIGRLRRLSAAKSNGVATGRQHALKGKKLPPLYRNPRIAPRRGPDAATGRDGWSRRSEAARSSRRSRSSDVNLPSACIN